MNSLSNAIVIKANREKQKFIKIWSGNSNKTRTSKVGAISKAQKAQNIFFGKKLEFSENFSRSENVAQCRKMYNGGPFLIYKHAFCCKITKKIQRGPFGTLKNFRKKVAQCRKNEKGDPLVSAGFVGYDKNGLTERGDPLQYLKCAASILVVL